MDLFEFFKETETAAGRIQRTFEEVRERIRKTDLTDAQKENLILKAGNINLLTKAAADMVDSVKAADGLVYDINSKAKMIGGEVDRGGRNYTAARRQWEFTRAYVSEDYGRDYINIYLSGNVRRELSLNVTLKKEDGKKARIDGVTTAADIESRIESKIAEMQNIADFAEHEKALEEKRAAVVKLAAEIKAACKGLYEVSDDFGFTLNSYSVFKSGRV